MTAAVGAAGLKLEAEGTAGAARETGGAAETWPEKPGAERIEPGTAAMAAGAARAGLMTAEAAES